MRVCVCVFVDWLEFDDEWSNVDRSCKKDSIICVHLI